MDTNTLRVTEQVILEQIAVLDQKLHMNVWALTKISLEFNMDVRMKLIDLNSYGDENFLKQTYLFISRTCLLTDLELRLESLKKHPLHDEIRQADGLVRKFGFAGVNMEDIPQVDYQAPDTFPSNTAFTDEIDHIIDGACTYIDRMDSCAEAVRDQLLGVRAKLKNIQEITMPADVVG